MSLPVPIYMFLIAEVQLIYLVYNQSLFISFSPKLFQSKIPCFVPIMLIDNNGGQWLVELYDFCNRHNWHAIVSKLSIIHRHVERHCFCNRHS